MIANDWGRLFRLQEAVDDAGVRLLLYRMQLSFHMEAVKFLRQAKQQFPKEIGAFIESLPEEARDLHQEIVCAQSVAQLRAGGVRDQSFHYPQIHRVRFDRGIEEMGKLMRAAEDLNGSVEASPNEPDFLEYDFADEIIVQLLPSDSDDKTDPEAVAAFRDRALAFRRFAELAISHHVEGQQNVGLSPSEEVELEGPEDPDHPGPA
ncbi:MAG: hypothetical protein IPK93_10345 [Solirubrobacterales bacterium]|nr:hypothetical protein [Solirubrobacterales bacterium]